MADTPGTGFRCGHATYNHRDGGRCMERRCRCAAPDTSTPRYEQVAPRAEAAPKPSSTTGDDRG